MAEHLHIVIAAVEQAMVGQHSFLVETTFAQDSGGGIIATHDQRIDAMELHDPVTESGDRGVGLGREVVPRVSMMGKR
jgi:hypothetical protein